MNHAINILQVELETLQLTQEKAINIDVIETLQKKIEETTSAIEVLIQASR